ncbi:MAG: hypothetical protein ABR511_11470, partial [Acidimicrobiales bacterium]
MNVDRFYEDRPDRRESPEATYGLEWRDRSDPAALFSLRWIRDTKEIYIRREPQGQRPAAGSGSEQAPGGLLNDGAVTVEVLGWAESQPVLDDALAGWERHMGDVDSLAWVRDQLEDAAAASQEKKAAGKLPTP